MKFPVIPRVYVKCPAFMWAVSFVSPPRVDAMFVNYQDAIEFRAKRMIGEGTDTIFKLHIDKGEQ